MRITASRSYQKKQKSAEYFDSPAVREPDKWITVDEARKMLGVTRMRVHQLSKEADAKGTPVITMVQLHPRLNMVFREDVEKYRDSRNG